MNLSDRVARLKSSVRIAEIAAQLNLERKGYRWFCPECQAGGQSQHKTPDMVFYGGWTFHCFKCGLHGDAISLVQLVKGCSFWEAMIWLENGIQVPGSLNGSIPQNENLNLKRRNAGSNRFLNEGVYNGINKNEEAKITAFLKASQKCLPGSLGENYLRQRGITLETAKVMGLGYSLDCQPLGKAWDSNHGRIIAPHTEPKGRVVNLYGRAVEFDGQPLKGLKHMHLPLPKGYFNSPALNEEEVFICEGIFDALALFQMGYQNVVAIFGVHGFKWEWVKAKRIILAMDMDQAGREATKRFSYEGVLRGKQVFLLEEGAYGGFKDLGAALAIQKDI